MAGNDSPVRGSQAHNGPSTDSSRCVDSVPQLDVNITTVSGDTQERQHEVVDVQHYVPNTASKEGLPWPPSTTPERSASPSQGSVNLDTCDFEIQTSTLGVHNDPRRTLEAVEAKLQTISLNDRRRWTGHRFNRPDAPWDGLVHDAMSSLSHCSSLLFRWDPTAEHFVPRASTNGDTPSISDITTLSQPESTRNGRRRRKPPTEKKKEKNRQKLTQKIHEREARQNAETKVDRQSLEDSTHHQTAPIDCSGRAVSPGNTQQHAPAIKSTQPILIIARSVSPATAAVQRMQLDTQKQCAFSRLTEPSIRDCDLSARFPDTPIAELLDVFDDMTARLAPLSNPSRVGTFPTGGKSVFAWG